MRHKITAYPYSGFGHVRAHFWDARGRYSTKTCATAAEAQFWIERKSHD